MGNEKLNLVEEMRELKTQLAYSKKLGFFFGAGTSCALNIPDIAKLTSTVEASLGAEFKKDFASIKEDLKESIEKVNIEDILNQVRRVREITNETKKRSYLGVSGEAAKQLDQAICKLIHKTITEAEEKSELTIPTKFFAWLDTLNRDSAKEIFTTNYDLIFERALEGSHIPFFDGFVGSYEPFFCHEGIDQLSATANIPKAWIRFWKIHGSLCWFWKIDAEKKTQKIIRIGKFDKANHTDQELVIYPSKEKYDSSRKQPFVAYFDRLKNCLLEGELFFVFAGYSFSDQHINDIVFNCLRQNKRLFCVVFFYRDEEVEALHRIASAHMNLNVFGPKKAIVRGTLYDWEFQREALKENEKYEPYFDEAKAVVKLGDFAALVDFLISSSAKAELAIGGKS